VSCQLHAPATLSRGTNVLEQVGRRLSGSQRRSEGFGEEKYAFTASGNGTVILRSSSPVARPHTDYVIKLILNEGFRNLILKERVLVVKSVEYFCALWEFWARIVHDPKAKFNFGRRIIGLTGLSEDNPISFSLTHTKWSRENWILSTSNLRV
jgi:hypothetical protein